LDDIELMSLVIAGEIDKVALLYERYRKPLYAYFFRLTNGDKQGSEDLVHTVFYRMIRYRASFSGKGNFAGWLFRIAHNTGIDHNLQIKRSNNYKIEAQAIQPVYCEQNDLEKNEEYATLQYAMSRLKQDEREILVLGKIDCLRYREIADILDTTESNVKIKIFRALRKLKDIYEKLEKTKDEKAGTDRKVV
jgi:RNA polymerase sigma factor (sigma-70 family)